MPSRPAGQARGPHVQDRGPRAAWGRAHRAAVPPGAHGDGGLYREEEP